MDKMRAMSTPSTKVSFKEQMHLAREEAILQATCRLLGEKAYDAMTMDDVANAVGIAKASLYKHFPSKEALAAAAMVRLMERTQAVVDQQAARPGASAMDQHAEVFGDVFLETMRAAEKSGNMTKVLEYLSEMLERSEETRLQIKSALMYPTVVVSVLSLAVLFLIGFVVPRFGRMFEARGVDLPMLTKVLLVAGESLSGYWWAYLIGVIAAGIGGHRYAKSVEGRLVIDRLLHKIPVVRELLVGAAVSRFARVFGLCLSSGIGLIDAIEMAGRASGRSMLQRDAEKMIDQVKAGGRVSKVLEACHYLPKFARRMIAAGEESAELPKMCSVVARQYDRETSVMAKNLATVIEPVMVVLIAGVVAMIALAVFMPMWDMVKLVG